MKTKKIYLTTLVLILAVMVQPASAIVVDLAAPTTELQKSFSADTFTVENEDPQAGLCSGLGDAVNPSCPQWQGTETQPESTPEEPISPEPAVEEPTPESGGEVLGISTTREEVTEKPQPAPAPKTIIQRIETREENPYALWTLTFLLFTMVFLTLAVIKTEIRLQHIIEHIRSKKRGGRKNTSL